MMTWIVDIQIYSQQPQDSNNTDNIAESTTNSFQHKKEGNHQ